MRQEYIEKYCRNSYRRFMKRSISKNDCCHQQAIDERFRIIRFYDQLAATATGEAFCTSRSTIFLWKQKMKNSKGNAVQEQFI
jgi:hypothetical protein